jgi:hypothetical protein
LLNAPVREVVAAALEGRVDGAARAARVVGARSAAHDLDPVDEIDQQRRSGETERRAVDAQAVDEPRGLRARRAQEAQPERIALHAWSAQRRTLQVAGIPAVGHEEKLRGIDDPCVERGRNGGIFPVLGGGSVGVRLREGGRR